jgi:hypothetical protein
MDSNTSDKLIKSQDVKINKSIFSGITNYQTKITDQCNLIFSSSDQTFPGTFPDPLFFGWRIHP